MLLLPSLRDSEVAQHEVFLYMRRGSIWTTQENGHNSIAAGQASNRRSSESSETMTQPLVFPANFVTPGLVPWLGGLEFLKRRTLVHLGEKNMKTHLSSFISLGTWEHN